MSDFSERLKEAFRFSGLSQVDLANYLNVNKSVVNAWIKGRTDAPNQLDKIIKIAKFLNVNPSWLCGFSDIREDFKIDKRELQLLKNYRKLNDSGKAKIDENINDLTQLEKYTAKDDYSLENEKKLNQG